MEPLEIDLEIKQGANFEFDLQVTRDGVAMDLTGYTGKLHVKQTKESVTTLVELQGQITFSGSLMMIRIPGSETTGYDFLAGVYDCKITPPSGTNGPYRVMEGTFRVSKQVTV